MRSRWRVAQLLVAVMAVTASCSRGKRDDESPPPASPAASALPEFARPPEGAPKGAPEAEPDLEEAPSTSAAPKEERAAPAPKRAAPGRDGLRQAREKEGGAAATSEANLEQSLVDARARFDAAMASGELSCAGADVHRRAICAIADQLCELARGDEGSERQRRCSEGRAACSDANARYRERCSG